jgi:hypothetical protein
MYIWTRNAFKNGLALALLSGNVLPVFLVYSLNLFAEAWCGIAVPACFALTKSTMLMWAALRA